MRYVISGLLKGAILGIGFIFIINKFDTFVNKQHAKVDEKIEAVKQEISDLSRSSLNRNLDHMKEVNQAVRDIQTDVNKKISKALASTLDINSQLENKITHFLKITDIDQKAAQDKINKDQRYNEDKIQALCKYVETAIDATLKSVDDSNSTAVKNIELQHALIIQTLEQFRKTIFVKNEKDSKSNVAFKNEQKSAIRASMKRYSYRRSRILSRKLITQEQQLQKTTLGFTSYLGNEAKNVQGLHTHKELQAAIANLGVKTTRFSKGLLEILRPTMQHLARFRPKF